MSTWNPERILLKRSGTPGNVPMASELEPGELAINTADGIIFTKLAGGQIVRRRLNASGLDRVIVYRCFIVRSSSLESRSTNYISAANGANVTVNISANAGQTRTGTGNTNRHCLLGYAQYNTNIIPVNSRIIGAYPEFRTQSFNVSTNFIHEMRFFNWGSNLTDQDWVAPANFPEPVIATFNTAGFRTGLPNFQLIGNVTPGFFNYVPNGSDLQVLINSDRHRQLIEPTAAEWTGTLSSGFNYLDIFVARD